MAEQKDTNYSYNGPLSGVPLPGGRDVVLVDGASVALPADNSFVKRLIALGRLKETPGASTDTPAPATKQVKAKEVATDKEDPANAG